MYIEQFTQTQFVTREGLNVVKFAVGGWDGCNKYQVELRIGDQVVLEKAAFMDRSVTLHLPAVTERCRCAVRVWPFRENPIQRSYWLEPVKKLTVGLLSSSHEDLGYCGYVNTLGAECADYLVKALDIYDANPEYRYFVEHYWWLDAFARYADEQDQQRLKKAFAEKAMEVAAPHSGVHTHWQGYEQIIRNLYPACIHCQEKWGIQPKTAIYTDVSGMSWGGVSAYAQAGIKYLMVLANPGFRMASDDEKLPNIFRWMAPNGTDSVICFRQYGYMGNHAFWSAVCDIHRQYEEGKFNFDETKARRIMEAVDGYIREFGDAPYHYIPISSYDDRQIPTSMLITVCNEMNSRYQNPRFEMTLPTTCMEQIEAEAGDLLPCLSGDLIDQWADFMTIAPSWNGVKRRSELNIPLAEMLSSVAAVSRGKPYPQEKSNTASWKLCEYDEHCWATSSSNPLNMHRLNLQVMKKNNAVAADRTMTQVIRDCVEENGDVLHIWNPLPAVRNTHVCVTGDRIPEGVRVQELEDGSFLTERLELPAFGYAVRSKAEEPVVEKPEFSETGLVETEYYRITCDFETCCITGIYDKVNGRELIDEDSPYTFGDFIYTYSQSRNSAVEERFVSSKRKLEILDGSIAVQILIRSFEEQSQANIRNVITFYRDQPGFDVTVEFQNATTLMGDKNDRYKKNFFFAFPFHVEQPRFLTELAGGVCDVVSQRLPVNPHDFAVARGWTAVQGENFGIGLYAREMPVFHYGNIHYNELTTKTDVGESSTVFVYAASNRCNQLNYLSAEDCRATYHFSVLPYGGQWAEQLPGWSQECDYLPFVISGGSKEGKSWIEIENRNVRLVTLKKAEKSDRFLLRLVETAGQKQQTKVKLPFKVEKAELATVTETGLQEFIQPEGDTIPVSLDKFSYLNLLLTPEMEKIPVEPEKDGIYNVFSYIFENSKTTVCFEKRGNLTAKEFEICCDGQKIATVPNDRYLIQYAEIDGIYRGEMTVREKGETV